MVSIKEIAGSESERKKKERHLARIYSVLSEEIREKLNNLDLPVKSKKKITKALAFLPEKKQLEYLKEIFQAQH